jgi:hypothetical protein
MPGSSVLLADGAALAAAPRFASDLLAIPAGTTLPPTPLDAVLFGEAASLLASSRGVGAGVGAGVDAGTGAGAGGGEDGAPPARRAALAVQRVRFLDPETGIALDRWVRAADLASIDAIHGARLLRPRSAAAVAIAAGGGGGGGGGAGGSGGSASRSRRGSVTSAAGPEASGSGARFALRESSSTSSLAIDTGGAGAAGGESPRAARRARAVASCASGAAPLVRALHATTRALAVQMARRSLVSLLSLWAALATESGAGASAAGEGRSGAGVSPTSALSPPLAAPPALSPSPPRMMLGAIALRRTVSATGAAAPPSLPAFDVAAAGGAARLLALLRVVAACDPRMGIATRRDDLPPQGWESDRKGGSSAGAAGGRKGGEDGAAGGAGGEGGGSAAAR